MDLKFVDGEPMSLTRSGYNVKQAEAEKALTRISSEKLIVGMLLL